MQVEPAKRNIIAKLATMFFFMLIFSILFSTAAYSSTNKQQQLDELNQQIQNNQQKINKNDLTKSQLDKEIKQADSNMYTIQTRLNKVLAQLNDAKTKTDATQAKLNILQAELQQKQQEHATALKKLGRLTVILDKRANNFYRSSGVSYLEVILSAKSFSDLLHQVYYLSRIINQDAKLVKQIKRTKAVIEAAKAAIEKNKTATEQKKTILLSEENKIASLTADLQRQKDSLAKELNSKKSLIASISSQNKQLAAALSNEKGDAAYLAQQIRDESRVNSPGNNTYGTTPGVPSISGFIWPCGSRGLIHSGGEWGNHRPTHYHAGIDIGVPSGTAVLAAKAGVASTNLAPDPGGYGYYIDINHGGGWVTRYAHLRKILVSNGEVVARGQQVAVSGGGAGDPGAGSSRGAHLHFELRDDGGGYGFSGSVNPLNYLP